jgi:hypothetical protein
MSVMRILITLMKNGGTSLLLTGSVGHLRK